MPRCSVILTRWKRPGAVDVREKNDETTMITTTDDTYYMMSCTMNRPCYVTYLTIHCIYDLNPSARTRLMPPLSILWGSGTVRTFTSLCIASQVLCLLVGTHNGRLVDAIETGGSWPSSILGS